MRKFPRRWVPRSLSLAQKIAGVAASETILRILQDAESNNFEEITTGDESWFRYCYPSSTMFAQAPSQVIPGTRQTTGAKNQ
jgi:hypothetical protein